MFSFLLFETPPTPPKKKTNSSFQLEDVEVGALTVLSWSSGASGGDSVWCGEAGQSTPPDLQVKTDSGPVRLTPGRAAALPASEVASKYRPYTRFLRKQTLWAVPCNLSPFHVTRRANQEPWSGGWGWRWKIAMYAGLASFLFVFTQLFQSKSCKHIWH